MLVIERTPAAKGDDEIGRLGDITNYMIDEIKVKYHLEKFVSQSAKSMIAGRKSDNGGPGLGVALDWDFIERRRTGYHRFGA